MTTRVIQREFVIQPGDETLPAVTLGYAWSSYMNTYAVWPSGAGDSVTIRRTLNLQAGNYYVTGTVDNYGSVNINGQYNISLYNFGANLSRTSAGNSTLVYHPGGAMTITISATNTGGPRGVAVTISEQIKTFTGPNSFILSVGNLVWSTRSAGTSDIGRYIVEMPFRANVTAHAWGAGGGGGGMDAGSQGGLGAPGLYNTTTFQVSKGDLLEIFVGSRGFGGSSNSGGAPGGTGGSSRLAVNGEIQSFNGGSGTAAGPVPYSGGGGGGGGASGVLVNNVSALVAGGGAGGGGAGNDGNGPYARRDAVITNNATGIAGSDFRGQNGQTKGGDGGGAGGGGGGYPGGSGGAVASGDASGFRGQCGGNYPIYSATTGTNTAYYKSGFAAGGNRGGGTGQNGRVFLLIEPISLVSVKVAGEWEQVQDAFVKVDGTWRDIDTIYIKINDTWRQLNGAGQGDVAFTGNTQSYGRSTRSYS